MTRLLIICERVFFNPYFKNPSSHAHELRAEVDILNITPALNDKEHKKMITTHTTTTAASTTATSTHTISAKSASIGIKAISISALFALCCGMSFAAPSLEKETLAGVSLQDSFGQALKKLGSPSFISVEVHDQLADCFMRVYSFKAHGIEVEVCRKGRKAKIRSLRSVKALKAVTSREVGIDSELIDVLRVYPDARVLKDHTVLVEDTQRKVSLRFIIEQGKVLEVNLFKDPTMDIPSSSFKNFFSSRR